MTPHPPFEFGYFSRHKYKDLVFYVKNPGEYKNFGLFEMDDTEENRAIMEALASRSPVKTERDKLGELMEWIRTFKGCGDLTPVLEKIGELRRQSGE